jgi:hypothetical protein
MSFGIEAPRGVASDQYATMSGDWVIIGYYFPVCSRVDVGAGAWTGGGRGVFAPSDALCFYETCFAIGLSASPLCGAAVTFFAQACRWRLRWVFFEPFDALALL